MDSGILESTPPRRFGRYTFFDSSPNHRVVHYYTTGKKVYRPQPPVISKWILRMFWILPQNFFWRKDCKLKLAQSLGLIKGIILAKFGLKWIFLVRDRPLGIKWQLSKICFFFEFYHFVPIGLSLTRKIYFNSNFVGVMLFIHTNDCANINLQSFLEKKF